MVNDHKLGKSESFKILSKNKSSKVKLNKVNMMGSDDNIFFQNQIDLKDQVIDHGILDQTN